MNERPKQRLFVGIELPDDARAAIMDLARPFLGIEGFRWVPAENLHLTVAFLGWTEPDAIDAIGDRVAAAAVLATPFTLGIGGLGRFPDRGKARVLWVGLEDLSGSLADLAEKVQDALRDVVEPEDRPFRAHVTIARARRPVAVRIPDDVAPTGPTVDVTAIALFRSHPGGKQARYEVLQRRMLGAEPSALP